MSRFLTSINAQTLITRLRGKGHLDDVSAERLGGAIQDLSSERELPLYLRIMSGIGAAIATGCLMGFLGITGVISLDSAVECLLWGTLFIANAIILLRNAEKKGVMGHSFLMQASFCCMGVGKMLIVGAAMQNHFFRDFNVWPLALAMAAVTAATWNFYRLSIDRFTSATAVLLLLFAAVMWEKGFDDTVRTIMMNLLVTIEVVAAAFLFTSGRVSRNWSPLAYALATSLGVKVILMDASGSLFHSGLSPAVVSILFALALIALIGWAADGLDRLREGPLALACLGTLLLATLNTPGILFSILTMVLGYARHDRKLLTLGMLMLPLFVWSFYYHLHVTLLVKSGILIFSGIVLLAGWAYMAARHLNKELKI